MILNDLNAQRPATADSWTIWTETWSGNLGQFFPTFTEADAAARAHNAANPSHTLRVMWCKNTINA